MAVTSHSGRIIELSAQGDIVSIALTLNALEWKYDGAAAGENLLLSDPVTGEAIFRDITTGPNYHIESRSCEHQVYPNGITATTLPGGIVRLHYQ